MEIVYAGTDKQGASLAFLAFDDRDIVLNVFEMQNPNLKEPADGIDVTARATG